MLKNKENSLISEIEQLEKENEDLRRKIYQLDEKELFETVKCYTYHAKYKFYRTIPVEFINTNFYASKHKLHKLVTGCFLEEILDAALETSKKRKEKELILHFAMACEDVFTFEDGVILKLSDPYRMIHTKPIKTISIDEAREYLNKIVLVKLVINDNYKKASVFDMKGIKRTGFSTYVDNTIVSSCSDIYSLKDISTQKEAIMALNSLQKQCKLNGSRTYRSNDTTLRIISKNKKMAIYFIENKFWYAEEEYPESSNIFYDIFKSDDEEEFLLEGEIPLNIRF